MNEADSEAGIAEVVAALSRSGRPHRERGREINTRCGFCGDSVRSASSMHFYISLDYPHPCYCQRCGFSSGELTVEVLQAVGAEDADSYARAVSRERGMSGRRRRRDGLRLGAARRRLEIPPPDRSDPGDAAAIGYLEGRLGFRLTEREVARYKVVACGLFGLLEANGITELTVPEREARRLNDSCVGWLSADESYAVFRNIDPAWEAAGGRRYTNYRLFQAWEGSKAFACRHDVDLLSEEFTVVATEGIIDLIAVERAFYPEERWGRGFVGGAANGATLVGLLRLLLDLGIMSPSVDLYADRGQGEIRRVRRELASESPFFSEPGFRLRVFQNDHPGQKDFGVPADMMLRARAKV